MYQQFICFRNQLFVLFSAKRAKKSSLSSITPSTFPPKIPTKISNSSEKLCTTHQSPDTTTIAQNEDIKSNIGLQKFKINNGTIKEAGHIKEGSIIDDHKQQIGNNNLDCLDENGGKC